MEHEFSAFKCTRARFPWALLLASENPQVITHLCKCIDPWWGCDIQSTLPLSLKSSTSTISATSSGGERFRTLCTVRSREDHPSLWNGIITLVFGSFSKYSLFLQLDTDRASQRVLPDTPKKHPKHTSTSILITSKQLSSFFIPQNDEECISFLNLETEAMNSCLVGLVFQRQQDKLPCAQEQGREVSCCSCPPRPWGAVTLCTIPCTQARIPPQGPRKGRQEWKQLWQWQLFPGTFPRAQRRMHLCNTSSIHLCLQEIPLVLVWETVTYSGCNELSWGAAKSLQAVAAMHRCKLKLQGLLSSSPWHCHPNLLPTAASYSSVPIWTKSPWIVSNSS